MNFARPKPTQEDPDNEDLEEGEMDKKKESENDEEDEDNDNDEEEDEDEEEKDSGPEDPKWKDVKSISELKRGFGTISATEPELKKHNGIIRSWIADLFLTNNKTNGFKFN